MEPKDTKRTFEAGPAGTSERTAPEPSIEEVLLASVAAIQRTKEFKALKARWEKIPAEKRSSEAIGKLIAAAIAFRLRKRRMRASLIALGVDPSNVKDIERIAIGLAETIRASKRSR